jgi:hypothetical protein
MDSKMNSFAASLAKNGISLHVAQELRRHSDPAWMVNFYTGASQFPTDDAVVSPPGEGSAP